MATIRPGIWEKIRNLDYGIPVQYRRTVVYIGPPFALYCTGWSIQWISLLDILFYLLVGLGNGDVGNSDQNVTSICACKRLYIV